LSNVFEKFFAKFFARIDYFTNKGLLFNRPSDMLMKEHDFPAIFCPEKGCLGGGFDNGLSKNANVGLTWFLGLWRRCYGLNIAKVLWRHFPLNVNFKLYGLQRLKTQSQNGLKMPRISRSLFPERGLKPSNLPLLNRS
jgi:hypothetical protein